MRYYGQTGIARFRKSLISKDLECQCGGIGRHTGFKIRKAP